MYKNEPYGWWKEIGRVKEEGNLFQMIKIANTKERWHRVKAYCGAYISNL